MYITQVRILTISRTHASYRLIISYSPSLFLAFRRRSGEWCIYRRFRAADAVVSIVVRRAPYLRGMILEWLRLQVVHENGQKSLALFSLFFFPPFCFFVEPQARIREYKIHSWRSVERDAKKREKKNIYIYIYCRNNSPNARKTWKWRVSTWFDF